MGGLFDTFTIAKRGLSVNQSQINTTSHNIANVETEGYTRQRSVASTTTPYGGNSKFDSCSVGQVGTGAEITSIERIRDSFSDYKVRTQQTLTSSLETQNQYLEQLNDYFSETSNNGLQKALSDMSNAFQSISTSSGTSSSKAVAIGKAETLASNINSKYTQLEDLNNTIQNKMSSSAATINSILDQVDKLNKQIETVSSDKITPNDLMDTRDNLLDKLSTYFGIKIDSQDSNGIDVSTNDAIASPASGKLISADSSVQCSRFSSVQSVTIDSSNNLVISYAKLGNSDNTVSQTVAVGDADLAKELKQSLENNRVLIAKSDGTVDLSSTTSLKSSIFQPTGGIINGCAEVETEVQKSMANLDKYAASIAYTVNAIQTASTTAASSDVLVFVANGTSSDTGINAKNISVNPNMSGANGTSLLNCATTSTSGETDTSRALAMAKVTSLQMNFNNITITSTSTREDFFKSTASGLSFEDSTTNLYLKSSSTGTTTIGEYYTSVASDVYTAGQKVDSDYTTAKKNLTTAKNDRTAVSGVSLDEETTNLIQYNHAYQANAKVVSVIDQLLDVVINGLMS